MVKKKSEEKKEKPSPKKNIKTANVIEENNVDIEKFSISELLEKKGIKPLKAVGFLNYYGLEDVFRKEFENKGVVVKFSEGEFDDMYKRYIEREI